MNRRTLFGLPLLAALPVQSRAANDTRRIRISLGQWSLHKAMSRRLLSNLEPHSIWRISHCGTNSACYVAR